MKRLLVILFALALLLACVPTPEQEAVFNKGDGTMEDVIESKPVTDYAVQSPSAGAEQPAADEHSAEHETPADEQPETPTINTLSDALGAPERCTDTFEDKVYGGTLKVEINADLEIPNVSKVPVYTVQVKNFTPEEREHITKLLLGDGPYFNYNRALTDQIRAKCTIEEYTQEISNYDNRIYGEDFPYESYREGAEFNMEQHMKSYAELPEPGPSEPWTGSFTNERTIVSDGANRYLGIAGDCIYFYDETGTAPMPFDARAPENAKEEAAMRVAETLFSDMTDASFLASGITYKEELFLKYYNLSPEKFPPKEYTVTLVRTVDGIPCYPYSAFHGSDTAKQSAGVSSDYDDPVRPEYASALVRDDKVTALTWYNAFDVVKTENENIALLPFERILELFEQQIFRSIYLDPAEKGDPESTEQMVVTRISLSYMKVKKKDAPNERYLLPVWDFMGYTYNARMPEKDLTGTKSWFSGQSLLTISAVDGSIIDRDRGY
jgi:hypothetical protein